MISKMKKYTFLVFHRDYEPFLEQLRELGVVHITEKAAGLIEDDETLQAALQHEDALRHLLNQGATDELIQERTAIEENIAAARQAAQNAAVWGEFDAARIAELKEAGYALRFFECPIKSFDAEWGIKVNEKEGKAYFVQVGQGCDLTETTASEIPVPEKSESQWLQTAEQYKEQLADVNARIEAWQKENINDIKRQLVEARQQIDWQRVTLSTDKLAEGALCLLEGFCPIDKEAELNATSVANVWHSNYGYEFFNQTASGANGLGASFAGRIDDKGNINTSFTISQKVGRKNVEFKYEFIGSK